MNTRHPAASALHCGRFMATRALAHGDSARRQNRRRQKEQKPWGIAGDAKAASARIDIRMTDAMRFTPDRLRSGRARR